MKNNQQQQKPVEPSKTDNTATISFLQNEVKRLQREYAACDDFPTARHDIEMELTKVSQLLRIEQTRKVAGQSQQSSISTASMADPYKLPELEKK